MYDSAKEMHFDEMAPGNKSPSDRSLIGLLKSPAIMTSATPTKSLPENPNELSGRAKLFLQETQAGSHFNLMTKKLLLLQIK